MSPQILIIDDDPIMQHIISYLLNKRGYDVETAEDGVHACHKLESLTPDVICLDMKMPDITGVDLLRCIRDELRLSQVPVIMMSSDFLPDMLKEARELGISTWLSKPITSETLSEVIERILKEQRQADCNQTHSEL